MSQLLIKRKNTALGSGKLEYGELGIAQNKLYFGGSDGKNASPIEVALKTDIPSVPLVDDTKLTIAATAREDGDVLPVALDSNGNLSVRVPTINNPAASKKIAFAQSNWTKIDSVYGTYKLSYSRAVVGFTDINYTVEILQNINNSMVQNSHCTIIKSNNNIDRGALEIYSSTAFNGYVIVTSGGEGMKPTLQAVSTDMPQIQFVGFKPNQITVSGSAAYGEQVSGELIVRILGQGLQVNDVIQLGYWSRKRSTNGSNTFKTSFDQVYTYNITESDIGQSTLILPFVVSKLQSVLKFAHGANNTFHRYPLWLCIKRPVYGTKLNQNEEYPLLHNIFSNQIQLHSHYKSYKSNTGGWLSFT